MKTLEHSFKFDLYNTVGVETTVTNRATVVKKWTRRLLRYLGRTIIVGIDCKSIKNDDDDEKKQHRTALLQLCTGNSCLIVQLPYVDEDDGTDDYDNYDYYNDDGLCICIFRAYKKLLHCCCRPGPRVSVMAALREFITHPRVLVAGIDLGRTSNFCRELGLPPNSVLDILSLPIPLELDFASDTPVLEQLSKGLVKCNCVYHAGTKLSPVSGSDWGARSLTFEQVRFACKDAYHTFKVVRYLISGC